MEITTYFHTGSVSPENADEAKCGGILRMSMRTSHNLSEVLNLRMTIVAEMEMAIYFHTSLHQGLRRQHRCFEYLSKMQSAQVS